MHDSSVIAVLTSQRFALWIIFLGKVCRVADLFKVCIKGFKKSPREPLSTCWIHGGTAPSPHGLCCENSVSAYCKRGQWNWAHEQYRKWMDAVEDHYRVCCWMKTVPPVDGGHVLHLSPSCHPRLQARPAQGFWSVGTHLARHLQPQWSRSRDDSSSALCWWRFLSALQGFLWRKASLLQSTGETALTLVSIHIILHSIFLTYVLLIRW